VKRLRQLEQENQRLKKMVAERDLELDVLKEITQKMVGTRVRRQQVAYAEGRGQSRRRVCALLSVFPARVPPRALAGFAGISRTSENVARRV
jgi:hypothetical protein